MTSNVTASAAAEERRIRDAALDETIEASFPASDPPSTLPNPVVMREFGFTLEDVVETARRILGMNR
jgi:hypothetical protein